MIIEKDKFKELVTEAETILKQKNVLFNFDVYLKFHSDICLNFDLHSFRDKQVISQYSFSFDYIEKYGLEYAVDEVIKRSESYFLTNLNNSSMWSPEKDRIVLVLDILGFKSMVSNLSLEEIYLKLYRVYTRFMNLKDVDWEYFKNRFWIEIFSDTIFVITSDCDDITVTMLSLFVSEILRQAVKMGIVFKGAFAEGKIIVDRENHICFGQPIIDAFLLEENQAWIGIACHNSVKAISEGHCNVVEFIDGQKEIVQVKPVFVNYNVPLKCGTENLLSFAWFNEPGISCGEIRKELLDLRERSPLRVKEYYDRMLTFMDYCQI